MKQPTKLSQYLNRFEAVIPQFETKNLKASKSSVGWQIDHSLKVINGIIHQLKASSNNIKPKRTLLGNFCLITRYIPRGKGKAPKVVLPPDTIKLNNLKEQLEVARIAIVDYSEINTKATFKHPYFGILNKTSTFKFLEVHTKHHLKIIEDILKD
ncbi:MAG: DUF1569 domain-containing protein [Winogradskyella sp.]|uniref:DUF1569 domain-containing protein n=1 Tax=Winogradskyella sp. TaxID=1883156 RepID=UPI0025DCA845|nr:DUF1569 domain-containing protein [Winogradskyella sp.]NRB82376.1 DUF1569 domain-containing protein [Winogradskyella sp.]